MTYLTILSVTTDEELSIYIIFYNSSENKYEIKAQ